MYKKIKMKNTKENKIQILKKNKNNKKNTK